MECKGLSFIEWMIKEGPFFIWCYRENMDSNENFLI